MRGETKYAQLVQHLVRTARTSSGDDPAMFVAALIDAAAIAAEFNSVSLEVVEGRIRAAMARSKTAAQIIDSGQSGFQ